MIEMQDNRTDIYKTANLIRVFSQTVFLLLFILGTAVLLSHGSSRISLLYSYLDPLAVFFSILFLGYFTPLFLLGILNLCVALFSGKVFCAWLCPLGAFQDGIEFIKKKLAISRSGVSQNEGFRPYFIKYIMLILLIAFSIAGFSLAGMLNPISVSSREVHSLNLGFIPLGVATVSALAFMRKRFYCRYICPLGGLLTLFSRIGMPSRKVGLGFLVNVDMDSCDNCGECADACPLGLDPRIFACKGGAGEGSECMLCLRCIQKCNRSEAMSVISSPELSADTFDVSRRATMEMFSLIGFAFLINKAGLIDSFESSSKQTEVGRLLRPPGSVSEDSFLRACIRCGRCEAVCPTDVLHISRSPSENGVRSLYTPLLDTRRDSCSGCLRCSEACPTGVISVNEGEGWKIGTAAILKEECRNWNQGEFCFVCWEQCPYLAISFDGRSRPVVDAAKCTGCGVCEQKCPEKGSAIRVYPDEEKRSGSIEIWDMAQNMETIVQLLGS